MAIRQRQHRATVGREVRVWEEEEEEEEEHRGVSGEVEGEVDTETRSSPVERVHRIVESSVGEQRCVAVTE
ncbi:unnamed protein product [Boreogadus saida]